MIYKQAGPKRKKSSRGELGQWQGWGGEGTQTISSPILRSTCLTRLGQKPEVVLGADIWAWGRAGRERARALTWTHVLVKAACSRAPRGSPAAPALWMSLPGLLEGGY